MSELDSVNAILRALVALNANEGEGELEAGGTSGRTAPGHGHGGRVAR